MVAELKVPQSCVLETMKVTCTLGCINKAAEQSSRLSKKSSFGSAALIKPRV